MRFNYRKRRFVIYSILLSTFVFYFWFTGKLSKSATPPTSTEPTTTAKTINIPNLYENNTVFISSNSEQFKCAAELNKTQPPFPALLIDVDFLIEISEEGCHIPEGVLKIAVPVNLVDSLNRIDYPRFDIVFYENSTDRDYTKIFGKETRAIPHLPLVSFGNWTMPKEVSLFAEYWRRSSFRDCLNINMNRTNQREVLPFRDSLIALTELRKSLVSFGMFPFLIEGSFLGWYRECGIIPHTNDMDFAVLYEQHNPVFLDLLKADHTKFDLMRTVGLVEDNYEISVKLKGKRSPFIDIFFMYSNGVNQSWIGGTLPDGRKFHFVYPLYDPYCSADIMGHHYWVTCSPKEMIEVEYGPEFKNDLPTENFDWAFQRNFREAGRFENTTKFEVRYRIKRSNSFTIFGFWSLFTVLFFLE